MYLLLKSKFRTYNCQWVNRLKESGKPYDLILTRLGREERPGGSSGTDYDQEGLKGGNCEDETVYVEVKSTILGPKEAANPFPMSYPELLFATEHKERYHVYRVFNTGTNAATVLAVSDFYRRLCHKSQLYCQVMGPVLESGTAPDMSWH